MLSCGIPTYLISYSYLKWIRLANIPADSLHIAIPRGAFAPKKRNLDNWIYFKIVHFCLIIPFIPNTI